MCRTPTPTKTPPPPPPPTTTTATTPTTAMDKFPKESARSQASDYEDDSASWNSSPSRSRQRNKISGGEVIFPWAKWLVLSVLIGSAALVTMAVYIFTANQQDADFIEAFETIAAHVLDSKDVNARNIRGTFDQFALSISTNVMDDSAWPTVTVPHWETQCQLLRNQTGSTEIALAPLVLESERNEWELYSTNHQGWLQESLDYYNRDMNATTTTTTASDILPYIWKWEEGTSSDRVPEDRPANPYYVPVWQTSPPNPNADGVNRNAHDIAFFTEAFEVMQEKGVQLVSHVVNLQQDHNDDDPISFILTPIYKQSSSNNNNNVNNLTNDESPSPPLVAVVVSTEMWRNYFIDLLPIDIQGILVVIRVACDQIMSFEINGPNAIYLGPYDVSDEDYVLFEVSEEFDELASVGRDECPVEVSVYPTKTFDDFYYGSSRRPLAYSLAALAIFIAAGGVFLLYDWTVQQVHGSLEAKAAKTDAIVNSLFPANVRDRLMEDNNHDSSVRRSREGRLAIGGSGGGGGDRKVSSGRSGGGGILTDLKVDESGIFTTKPIADLFPSATVMFADIVGFTAWSSTREPSQVFTLLETVYNSFDKIAHRRRVFKVETIGDCYVAAAGLPDPRPDHALVMARFANDCLLKMKYVVQRLEVALGPETGDLGMRFGLHSGPVTAGVLRGEKSRFQLFGDTVNTAARIENLGGTNKIHVSAETAEKIEAHGKSEWLEKREQKVQAKGKGEIQTYWLDITRSANNSNHNNKHETTSVVSAPTRASFASKFHMRPMDQIAKKVEDKKLQRLIGWNVDVLKRQLRLILAMRDPSRISEQIATIYDQESDDDDDNEEEKEEEEKRIGNGSDSDINAERNGMSDRSMPTFEILQIEKEEGKTVLDEVKEIIVLPTNVAKTQTDPFNIEFSAEVISQLTDYVTAIAQMYHENPFHSFEHASHVTMSVCKLLARIVTPDSIDYDKMEVKKQAVEDLHSYTYGITSDPITQFACTLAALIHDVDHPGVPNAQLVKEKSDTATHYKNKSVAEQNSVDLAWELLMEPQYSELRSCIYTTNEELNRFRQLLVNSVMATDIADKELGALRKKRWAKAFSSSSAALTDEAMIREDSNRKATIVIEHLIQASDVSHTMQHWHIYLKWNERLFQEMYKGYKDGRFDADPSKGWYKGELGFFDFYLIPLAKKLQECRVFGSASDEYLNYAQANRKEWEVKGKEIVEKYLQNYEKDFGKLEQGGIVS